MLIFAQSKKSFQKNSKRRSHSMFRWFRSSAPRQSNATLFVNKKNSKWINSLAINHACLPNLGQRGRIELPFAPDKGLEPPSLFKATSVFKTDLLPIRVIRQNADTPPPEPLQRIYPSVLLEIILSDCSVAVSFYLYNGAETITISVSLTFHLS